MSEALAWSPSRPVAAVAMHPGLPAQLLGEDWAERIGAQAELVPTILDGSVPDDAALRAVEVLVACWGCPRLDEEALEKLPNLRAVVYAAGSVKEFATEEMFARGITVCSAAGTNALPVAEFTVASILFAGKRVFSIAEEYKQTRDYRPSGTREERWGNYGLVVGIVGASRIGRRVIELLRPFDVEVLVYDPIAPDDIPGVRRVELAELVSRSDVVSLHAPSIPATRHMIDRAALASMRDGATLINTARGALVDEDALADELYSRRIHAIIDVTEPDPPRPDSRLFDAPNLVLTPHIAGSQGNEMKRLGDEALRELGRFGAGEPFAHPVQPEAVEHIA